MIEREKAFLSLLVVTAFACGVAFVIMYQVEEYDREKIWSDLDTNMPKHNIKPRPQGSLAPVHNKTLGQP